MKKSVFDVQHTHQIGNSSPASEKFAEFALSKTTHTQPELYSQLYNQVAVGARDLSTCLFSANSKFQTTILKCLDVLPKLLPESEWFFCKEFSYPVDFEFFFIRSKIHCELIQSRLSSEWPLQVSNVINTNLSELLNFNIKNIKIYQSSRTRDFLRLVSLIMSTQLRWFITQGMIKFLGILNIKSIRVGSPTVDDEHSRKETLEEFDSDMVHTVPHFDAVNLNAEVFLIKVTTTDIENSITVVSVPALRDIEDMVRFLFELPSELTRAVPGQESIIMNKIFMNPGDETFISGLENDNRLLAEGKLAIKKLLHESIKSLSSVIDLFTEFAFLINQSIDQEVFNDFDVYF